MISRVCAGADGVSCGRLVPASKRRCDRCQLANSRARGSSSARGYGGPWRRVSERQRREVPWCQLRLPGCTGRVDAADHIVPIWAGGKSTRGNAQSACASCNNAKRDLDRRRGSQ